MTIRAVATGPPSLIESISIDVVKDKERLKSEGDSEAFCFSGKVRYIAISS